MFVPQTGLSNFMPKRRDGRHGSVNAAINWLRCHGASFHACTGNVTLVLGQINADTRTGASCALSSTDVNHVFYIQTAVTDNVGC